MQKLRRREFIRTVSGVATALTAASCIPNVRLPGSAISLLPAVLIPALRTFGPLPTTPLAISAVLLGNVARPGRS